jgi:hypothetical protein
MQLTPENHEAINKKVANKLRKLLKQIEERGIESLGFDFENIEASELSDKAADALASDDVEGCLVLDVMSSMHYDGDLV